MNIKDPSNYYGSTWSGTASDDILIWSDGDDVIDGGDGSDTLSINSNSSEVTVSTNSENITYINIGGTYGDDLTVTNIEKIALNDKDFTLTTLNTDNIVYDPSNYYISN